MGSVLPSKISPCTSPSVHTCSAYAHLELIGCFPHRDGSIEGDITFLHVPSLPSTASKSLTFVRFLDMGKSQGPRQILSSVSLFWEGPSAGCGSSVFYPDVQILLLKICSSAQLATLPLWLRGNVLCSALLAKWPPPCRESVYLHCVSPGWLCVAGDSLACWLFWLCCFGQGSHPPPLSQHASLFLSHVAYPQFLGNYLSFLLIA